MKLIVLYGPEKSGKTTTLKMVYEKLKKKNKKETQWFAYYDSDNAHLDFRDVLALDSAKIAMIQDSVNSMYEYIDFSNLVPQIFKCFLNKLKIIQSNKMINKDSVDKFEIEIKKNINEKNFFNDGEFTTNRNIITKFQNIIDDLEGIDKKRYNINECNLRCGEEDLSNITDYKVGFVLEGDYGFVHSWHSPYAKHTRNLYEHLKQLIGCDTIICACSAQDVPLIRQPLLCLLSFIVYCVLQPNIIPLQLYVLQSDRDNEQNIANQIIQLI